MHSGEMQIQHNRHGPLAAWMSLQVPLEKQVLGLGVLMTLTHSNFACRSLGATLLHCRQYIGEEKPKAGLHEDPRATEASMKQHVRRIIPGHKL